MNDAICGQCGATVPADQLVRTLVGSYCRQCHHAEIADIPERHRAFMRSLGWRQLFVGLLMLVIGSAVLAIGVSGAGSLMVIPAGLLIGGVIEIILGVSKLSSNP